MISTVIVTTACVLLAVLVGFCLHERRGVDDSLPPPPLDEFTRIRLARERKAAMSRHPAGKGRVS